MQLLLRGSRLSHGLLLTLHQSLTSVTFKSKQNRFNAVLAENDND